MGQSKAKRAFDSIIFGVLNKLVVTVCPFVVRTVMIYTIGEQYIGLNSVFVSILQILSFAELGIGNVMIYSMYKPLAENKTEEICALLNLYKKIYRIIGIIVLLVGLAILPMLHLFIKGEHPSNVNIYILYLIYLFNSVISYWAFIYKDAIISVHQKYYLSSNINTIASMIMYIGEVIALLFVKNYYFYVICIPLGTILNNLGIAWIANKKFPQYVSKGNVDKKVGREIRKTVLAGIGHKLGPAATNSVDNLVISSFLGLTAAAIYSNYSYIVSMVNLFLAQIFGSFVAGVGNSIVTDSREKNYEDFCLYTFSNNWITGWCSICLMCLSQHFMWIWIGEQKGTQYLYDTATVVIFTIMFYVQQIRTIVTMYKSAAGMWYADRYKPYVATILNLVLDICLVRLFGINGIFLATIFARAAVGLPWETAVMFKQFFKKKQFPYYMDLVKYAAITVVVLIITYCICEFFPSEGVDIFCLKMLICVFVPNILYCMLFWKNQYFKVLRKKVLKYISKKVKKKTR